MPFSNNNTTWQTNPMPWMISYERYQIRPNINMPDYNTSLLDIFENSFTNFSQQTAYICHNQTLSYQQLDKFSLTIATFLQQSGLHQGDKVGVMLPNLLQYPILILGVLRAGMVLVTINPLHTVPELTHQLCDAEVKTLFVLDKFFPVVKKVSDTQLNRVIVCRVSDLSDRPFAAMRRIFVQLKDRLFAKQSANFTVDYLNQILTTRFAKPYYRPFLNLHDVATLQYTGGTTGTAKGAMLTHGNIIANVLQIDNLICSAYEEEGQGDTILAALPLYYVFSFTITVMYCLFRGFTGLLITDPRHIQKIITTMRRYPPSFILGVNTLFRALLQNPNFRQLDFSQLKATIGGGMTTSESIAKQWHKVTGSPIIEGYGLSETAPVVTFNPLTIAQFTNKVGIPAPATDVKLIDNNDLPVPIGERGELIVKGPQVMKGYHNRPQDTADSFTSHGYLRTGDIGIMDERGFIKIVDRKKDMILVSGFNVYPSEIESVMMTHPDVVECAAIGIPSAERGEEPKIYVVRRRESLTAEELMAFGREHLTGYKRPRHVAFVDSLPKSHVGKVLRIELRKREGLA